MKVATYRIGFLVAFVTPTWRCRWKAVFLGGEALVINFVWWEVSWLKVLRGVHRLFCWQGRVNLFFIVSCCGSFLFRLFTRWFRRECFQSVFETGMRAIRCGPRSGGSRLFGQ